MADEGASQAHTVFRVLQILTLIPAWALIAAIVHWYNSNTVGAPGGVLCLFIVTLLASVWAFCILVATQRAGNTSLSIAFTDVIAMAALIAAVATTSNIANYECNTVAVNTQMVYITSTGERITMDDVAVDNRDRSKTDDIWDHPDYCNLIKGAWGLAIANIIMFFITAILSVVICRQNDELKEAFIVEQRAPPPVIREKFYADDYPRRPRRAARSHRSSRSTRSRPRSQAYIIDDAV
jgi:hypothetical protein